MKAVILDGGLFDDGSLDCKTFGFAHDEGTDIYSGPSFLKEITEPEVYEKIIDLVKQLDAQGIKYLVVKRFLIYFGGVQLLEIQWD